MSDSYSTISSLDNPNDIPHGWIQWKGTDVCIDLHCACGTHGHFDGDFMYKVQCKDCGRKYVVGQNVKLIELDSPELIKAAESWGTDDYHPFSEED